MAGNGVANGLVEAFHHLPQSIIEGLLGQKLGGMVESGLGIPLGEPQPAPPNQTVQQLNQQMDQAQRQRVADSFRQQAPAQAPLKMNLRGR